jgi:nucleoside-diphosphate-sugar epimerase
LTDGAALEKFVAELQPEIVIHLAGLAFVGHGDANNFYQVNLLGTRNLLAALATCAKAPEAVLLASSANVYGNASSGMLDEATPPAPANDYAVSKLAMEYMARMWMEQLPLIIVRPFNYTGIGQAEDFVLAKIVAHFRCQAPDIALGNLDVWRDFGDVRVLVKIYRRLIEARALGVTVNVGSGNTHSLREVVAVCEQITGHRMQIRVVPAFVRVNEVKSLCADVGLLRRLIGDWTIPALEQTLRWMLEAE